MATILVSTCFALILSPISNQSTLEAPIVFSGYSTIEAAEQARSEALWGPDASGRIKREKYEASPQYKIDQEKQKQEEAERQKKCTPTNKNTLFIPCGYNVSTMSFNNLSIRMWNEGKIISIPDSYCKKE